MTADAPPPYRPVYDLADHYVESLAALDPIRATSMGVAGHDDRLTDFSPSGIEARAELDRDTAVALAALEPGDDRERVAAAFLQERLATALGLADAGEPYRALRNLGSPVQAVRQVFDLMPRATPEDWELIGRRLHGVPAALDGLCETFRLGLDHGLPAAPRQAREAAAQAATWAGDGDDPAFFPRLVAGAAEVAGVPDRLIRDLTDAADAATTAYGDLATFLRDDYAPRATGTDAVGRDRYAMMAASFLGAEIDLDETYAWGWDQLRHVETELARVAEQVRPGAGIDATIEWLETGSDLAIEGEDALRDWLQDLMDRTIADLDGTHFDIPAPVRQVEAMIAPPGGAAAMYYTGPSEDFSRPGRTWYPTLGKTRFPLWGEVSIAYHEGVPGHHLQVGQVRYLRDELSRFQRVTFVAGHGEGWALYAERLMHELGYLDQPAFELGMWRAQAMRAARVIVDIGMHLELPLPEDQDFHPGARWTPELGQAFVDARSRFPRDFMASEIVRYLGLPGQAISYKVGERVWLDARAQARSRHGAAFDLTAFHRHALDLGPLGLDQLRDELARF